MTQKAIIKKILIVDDDPVQVKLLSETLGAKGYEITTSVEAAKGLQAAMDNAPDLIILDVMMPIINGYNFCKLLKSHEAKKQTPIILLTSRDQKEDIDIGMEVGADAYLTKPVNMTELLRTINCIAAGQGPTP
jgi:DNA-binding response OmpR family regulator